MTRSCQLRAELGLLVEPVGIEPATFCVANATLSQLSYGPFRSLAEAAAWLDARPTI